MNIEVSDDGFFVSIRDGDKKITVSEGNSIRVKDADGRWQTVNIGICIHKHSGISGCEGRECFELLKSNCGSMEEAVITAVNMLPFLDAKQVFVDTQRKEKVSKLREFVKGIK